MATLTEEIEKLLKQKRGKNFILKKLNITEEDFEKVKKSLIKEKSINFYQVAGFKAPEVKFTTTSNEKGTYESTIELDYEPKSDIELAELHKIDLTKYKISTYWSKLKSNGKFTSSVLASLKKPQDYTAADFAKFLEKWEPSKSIRKVTSFPDVIKQFVDVEINLSDFHLAKKTINKDNIESKTFDYLHTLTELVVRVKNNYNIRKIVFPISNDFFHSDNYQNTTTNGTPQDVTVWYDEEYEYGFDILADSIKFLSENCLELEIVLVQGNHDRTKGFYVAHALEVLFKKELNIKFQRHHSTTKAVVLGSTFIGYHHGNSCKIDDLPLLFATVPEFSKQFGNAKYREIHTGDKHHYMAKDIKGVRIQQLPSLSGDDRWHIDNNFINSVRAGIAFVYDPEKGKIAEFESRV